MAFLSFHIIIIIIRCMCFVCILLCNFLSRHEFEIDHFRIDSEQYFGHYYHFFLVKKTILFVFSFSIFVEARWTNKPKMKSLPAVLPIATHNILFHIPAWFHSFLFVQEIWINPDRGRWSNVHHLHAIEARSLNEFSHTDSTSYSVSHLNFRSVPFQKF